MGRRLPESGTHQTQTAFALGQRETALHLCPLTFIYKILPSVHDCVFFGSPQSRAGKPDTVLLAVIQIFAVPVDFIRQDPLGVAALPGPKSLHNILQIPSLVIGVKRTVFQPRPAVYQADVQLGAKLHRFSGLPPHYGTNKRLAHTYNPIRDAVGMVVVHVLLLGVDGTDGLQPFQLSDEEKRAGFQVLFDGTNMHAWCGNTGDYILEDGCISMVPSRSFGGNLYTKAEFADFVYRFEFQLTPGANNGVGLRAPLEGDAAYVGMESQILDCEHPIYSNITPLQHHGSIYGILPANEKHTEAMKPVGEWNYEEIVCKGDYVKVTLNGVVIVEGNLREATQHGTPDGQEHPGLFNRKGHIGFLGHGSPIKFRNIRILELK